MKSESEFLDLLSKDAEFFDVEGIPVSLGEPSAGLYSAAWDVVPPRDFNPESARRNGAPIPADEFARMVVVAMFSPRAEFFDVEGIPVSFNEPLGKFLAAAWDETPPRKFSVDSMTRNGTRITPEEFAADVAAIQADAKIARKDNDAIASLRNDSLSVSNRQNCDKGTRTQKILEWVAVNIYLLSIPIVGALAFFILGTLVKESDASVDLEFWLYAAVALTSIFATYYYAKAMRSWMSNVVNRKR